MRIIDKFELEKMETESYVVENFCGLRSDTLVLILSTIDYTSDFLKKNNIKVCIDLTALTMPDGLNGNDDNRAFLGLAAGARAIKQASESSEKECRVIIHCNKGLERSPSTLAYYLIRYSDCDGKRAVDLVRSALACRKGADIYDSSHALQAYYPWLEIQSSKTLEQYENRVIAKGKKIIATLSDSLPNLFSIVDDGLPHVKIFQIKGSRDFNKVIKSLKEAEQLNKAALQKPKKKVTEQRPPKDLLQAKEKPSASKVQEKAKQEEAAQVEKKAEPPKAKSSTTKMLGMLSKRTSTRLKGPSGDGEQLLGSSTSEVSGKVRFSSPPKLKTKQGSGVEPKVEDNVRHDDESSHSSEQEAEDVQSFKPRF